MQSTRRRLASTAVLGLLVALAVVPASHAERKSVVLTLNPATPPHFTYTWGAEPHLLVNTWFEGSIVATVVPVIDPAHGLVADRLEIHFGEVRKLDNADDFGSTWQWTEFDILFTVGIYSDPFGGSVGSGEMDGTAIAPNTSTFDLAPIQYTLDEGQLVYTSDPPGWGLPTGTTSLATNPVAFELTQTATATLVADGNGQIDVTLSVPLDGSAMVDDGNGLAIALGGTLEFTGTTVDEKEIPAAPRTALAVFAIALAASAALCLHARARRSPA